MLLCIEHDNIIAQGSDMIKVLSSAKKSSHSDFAENLTPFDAYYQWHAKCGSMGI